MKIYIDSEYCCYTTNQDGVFQEIETDFFDGKCDDFIEGYRYIPFGKSWTRPDGVVFDGEMISPWKDFSELIVAQNNYEKQKLVEYKEAFQELGVDI